MKRFVIAALSNVSTEARKSYEEVLEVVKLDIQENLVHERKNMETHFQVEAVDLSVIAGDELLRWSSEIQQQSCVQSVRCG